MTFSIKRYHIFISIFAYLLVGCKVTTFELAQPRPITQEYRQKVGLYVHDRPERFFYPGSATLDVSDLMAFHLQQVLPFTAQAAFQEIFEEVEIKDPGPKIEFKTPDLAGYFEIKIASARYDYPDPGASTYRAEIQLLVEFRTFRDEVVWQGLFDGEGIGFSDPNVRLTPFGREAASALEEAFQNAVYKMQDEVLRSPLLREYFRWYQAKKLEERPPRLVARPKPAEIPSKEPAGEPSGPV